MSKDFNGTTDVIDLGSPAGLDDVVPITIAAWIFPDTFGESGNGTIFSKGTVAVGGDLRFVVRDVEDSFRLIRAYSGADAEATATVGAMPLDTWSFVAATLKAGDGGPRLFIGDLDTATAETGYNARQAETGSPDTEAAANAYIGNSSVGDRTFDGFLAHVSVWDQALSVSQLERLRLFPYAPSHRFSVAGTVAQLRGYWPLWESVASVARDHSGNGNHGTVTGTTVAAEPPMRVHRARTRVLVSAAAAGGNAPRAMMHYFRQRRGA